MRVQLLWILIQLLCHYVFEDVVLLLPHVDTNLESDLLLL